MKKVRELGNPLLLLFPIASGLLVSASFSPLDLGFLAWVGLSPLLYVLRQRRYIFAASAGWSFGIIFITCTFYWILSISVLNILKFLIFLSIFSIYFIVFGILYRLVTANCRRWIIIGAPALWVTMEYIRSNIFFLSFPLNLLGHSQYQYLSVIQIADITGVYGISFLIVLTNQFLSYLPDYFTNSITKKQVGQKQSFNIRRIVFPALAFLPLLLTIYYGWYRLKEHGKEEHVRVALIQANILTSDNMSFTQVINHLKVYDQMTREAARMKPDLIVWPSSSLPLPLKSRIVNFAVKRLAGETQTYVLVGGAGGEKYGIRKNGYLPYSNSEFLVSPSGNIEGQYNKIWLLPFNEYLPMQEIITWPQWITQRTDSFQRGKDLTIFQVAGAKFGTPICWENLFPDPYRQFVKNGAQFMVSVTNEGFFGNNAAPYQTLAINTFRAVENRIAIARAATTGVSAFINPNGEIMERITDKSGKDIFVSGILIKDIPINNRKTFYTLYGDVFSYAIIAITVIMIFHIVFLNRFFRHSSGIIDE